MPRPGRVADDVCVLSLKTRPPGPRPAPSLRSPFHGRLCILAPRIARGLGGLGHGRVRQLHPGRRPGDGAHHPLRRRGGAHPRRVHRADLSGQGRAGPTRPPGEPALRRPPGRGRRPPGHRPRPGSGHRARRGPPGQHRPLRPAQRAEVPRGHEGPAPLRAPTHGLVLRPHLDRDRPPTRALVARPQPRRTAPLVERPRTDGGTALRSGPVRCTTEGLAAPAVLLAPGRRRCLRASDPPRPDRGRRQRVPSVPAGDRHAPRRRRLPRPPGPGRPAARRGSRLPDPAHPCRGLHRPGEPDLRRADRPRGP